MTYDRVYLKEGAQASMRGYKPSPMGVTAVYLVIGFVLQMLTLRVTYFFDNYTAMLEAAYYGYTPYIRASTAADQSLALIIGLVTVMLGVGFSIFCMHVSRRQKGGFEDIFLAFPKFFRYLGLTIVMGIFVWLWSLLLIVPGIIAAYRYRLAIYLAVDNPDWGIMQCIRESKRLMYGNKGKAFVLDLSFIGWSILTGMTFGILGIWTAPYIEITNVRFYEYALAVGGRNTPYTNGAPSQDYEVYNEAPSAPELPDNTDDTNNSNDDGDSFWK